MYDIKFMELADEAAAFNEAHQFKLGGPFGAVVVKDGKVVGGGCNTVLLSKDPTCHAEITAIRAACEELGTHDLSGCELYTSCYPCPMCLGAIVWSNIKTVYYGNSRHDAAEIGFRDDDIYKFLEGDLESQDLIHLSQHDRDLTIELFKRFKANTDKQMY